MADQFVIQILELADGTLGNAGLGSSPFDGKFVARYEPHKWKWRPDVSEEDLWGMMGQWLGVVRDPGEAIRFADVGTAIEFYKQALTVPRPDGKPNRPLTAFTVAFEPLDDAPRLAEWTRRMDRFDALQSEWVSLVTTYDRWLFDGKPVLTPEFRKLVNRIIVVGAQVEKVWAKVEAGAVLGDRDTDDQLRALRKEVAVFRDFLKHVRGNASSLDAIRVEDQRAARIAARRRDRDEVGKANASDVKCVRCRKRDRHFDDLCKRCANEAGQRPTGKIA